MTRTRFVKSIIVMASALVLVAGCSSQITTPTAVSNGGTVVVPFTPNPQDAVLPTLLPTVVIPPTAVSLPTVAVTVTEIPSITPIQVTPTVPVVTRPPTTVAPAETATPLPEGLPKVFVTALRVEPTSPKADQGGTFFVTFQNASGENQSYRWAVEPWREDEKKPFGLTTAQSSTFPVGITTLTSTGWAPTGQGECVSYHAKVVAIDDDDNRSDFIQRDGTILWLDFSVCP